MPFEFRTKELEAPGLGPRGAVVDREVGKWRVEKTAV